MAIRKDYKNIRLFHAYPVVPEDIMWLPECVKKLRITN